MPTLQKDDVTLNYQTFGDENKPALIFSNSLGTNYSMWQPQIDALQDDFFVICYDTRGHGQSSAPDHPYSIDELGQDVVDLLNHLQIKKANFCGISMGGLTGQWLAINKPEYFNIIIVSNTAAKIGNETAWQARADQVRNEGLQPIADTAASRWFTEGFIKSSPDIVKQMSENLAKGSPEGYANCCAALATADLREDLQKASVPMLVIAGMQDLVTTAADAKAIVAVAPNGELATIDASHIANVEQPEAFTQLILGFCQSN